MRSFFLLAFLFSIGLMANSTGIPTNTKDISIAIDSTGHAYIGRDTLAIDQLAAELEKRLWKGYMGTGEMYSALHLSYRGEVLMGVRGAAMDAIHEAQKNVANEVSLQLHKKLFADLTEKKKKKIRKKFPVLFQKTFD